MYEIKKDTTKVNEAVSVYVKNLSVSKLAKTIKTKLTFSDFLSDRMLIVHAIRTGIPYSLFKHIKTFTPFSDEDWADFLNISAKSLQRYKSEKNHIFKPIHSEKIIELAEVTDLGHRVFDSPGQFYQWLNTSSFALGNLKPFELLKDSYGKEMVMNELNRIDQGIFA